MTYSIIQKSQLEGAVRLDAEYYQLEYFELEKKLKSGKFLNQLSSQIICGPFGSAILNSDYQYSGVPLIRVADLNDWFVKDNDLVFINSGLSNSLKRYQVVGGDIVVSQRGTIAMFSKVTDKFPVWNISANLIAIKKTDKIDFDYLLAFLNSRYGISQLERKLSGQVQPKITTNDIRSIQIFLPSAHLQVDIGELVKTSRKKELESKNFYHQAEDLLLEELGLKDFDEENKLFSIVNLSDCQKFNRVDNRGRFSLTGQIGNN